MQSTKRSVFPLKKSIALIMALSVLVCGVFAACSSKKTDGQNSAADTTQAGLANADTEFGTEINKDGKEVDVAYEINKNGEKVTKSNGDYVEVPIEDDKNNNGNDNNDNNNNENGNGGNNNGGNGNENLKPNPVTPQEPDEKGDPTEAELTTIEASKDKVPSTNASGKKVIFNQQDLERIAAMLEVPGLYKFSYENKDGVSAEMATHVAVWMAAREDIKGTSFPSGTIVLDLFKYYGQTVVNFKSNCNAAAKKENIYDIINYSNKDSVFTIAKGEAKQQSVKINRVESLGNNNYYKVTGSVSGAKSCKKVVAVVQKNRLDTELGFSVKALKWS